jgi:zinc ribbon protein
MPDEEKAIHEGPDGPAAREWGRSSTGDRPGQLTTPVPQVSRFEPASQMLMFGGLHRRAQEAVREMLLPDEQPRVVIPGAGGSGIVGTDSRAFVLKIGARFGAPFRGRWKAFEYESVIGIRFDTETVPAVVAIDAPHKIGSCRVYWADARDDPWKARNAIPVDVALFGTVLEQIVALRGLIDGYRDLHPALLRRPGAQPPRPMPTQAAPADDEGGGVVPLPVLTDRCPQCRAELRAGWRFCPECGTPSSQAPPARRS